MVVLAGMPFLLNAPTILLCGRIRQRFLCYMQLSTVICKTGEIESQGKNNLAQRCFDVPAIYSHNMTCCALTLGQCQKCPRHMMRLHFFLQ